jgi:GDPmannose 4,6-dehydratase
MNQKIAMISGITGQDGGYLAKLLLEKGYRVIGLYRRASTDTFCRLKELNIYDKIELMDFDLLEFSNICRLINTYKPDEFYNLAAQSFVACSWNEPIYTVQADGVGVLYILEAIRLFSPKTRLYQASTSEMFGKVQEIPQTEKTPFYPRSPYGVAKMMAHWMCINYWESFGIFACSGILFNHESPMRGLEFVTRKITHHFARLATKQTTEPLKLGNIDSKRDWCFCGDCVEMMWLMLQQDTPETYVISSGETHSVREFVETVGVECGFDIEWRGKGIDEVGIDRKTGNIIVTIDSKFYRPAEVDILLGNPEKASKKLGWKPKTSYQELCHLMITADLERAQKGLL